MKKLNILWTNDNMHTVQNMVFMYATNSMIHHWWDEVQIIIWGATAKLTAENEDVQQLIEVARHAGVKISACQACARALGVRDKLKELDIEIISWGPPLTEIIQNNEHLLSV